MSYESQKQDNRILNCENNLNVLSKNIIHD